MFKQIMRDEFQIMTIFYKDETNDDFIPLYLMDYFQEDLCTQEFKMINPPTAFSIRTKEEIIQDYLDRVQTLAPNFICLSVFYHPEMDESELIFCTDGPDEKSEPLKHLRNAMTLEGRVNEIKLSAFRENIIKLTLYYKAGFIEEYYLNCKNLKEGGHSHG